VGGIRLVFAHETKRLLGPSRKTQRHAHAKAHAVCRRRLDQPGAGASGTPVTQFALDAGTQRRIIALAGRLPLRFELAHPRLYGGESTSRDEVRMRADGPVRELPGIGVGLADERAAHAASPAVPVTR